jgi:Ca2+-binding EF-hand superfamily protein
MKTWIKALSLAALTSAPAVALAQAPAPAPNLSEVKLGPIDNLADIEATLKMAFKLADADNNNAISQKEATDLAHILAGGAFFAADANGDGVVSDAEGKAARDQMLQQRPLLRYVVLRAQQDQQASGQPGLQKPIQDILTILDTNQDKQLQATEVRQAVQTGVQVVFSAGDTNRDGQLTPDEVERAGVAVVNLIAQGMFQTADKDNNGQISKDEYLAALAEPAQASFAVLDANADGQLSADELQKAQQIILGQLQNLQVPDTTRSSGYNQPPAGAPAPAPAVPVQGSVVPR